MSESEDAGEARHFEGPVAVRQRAAPIIDAAALLASLGTGIWVATMGASMAWAIGLGAFAIGCAALRPLIRRRSKQGLTVHADHLRFGKRRVARKDLVGGVLLPTGDSRATVELTTKHDVIEIELPLEEARALLETLDLGPKRRRLQVRRLEHGMAFAAASIAVGAPVVVAAIAAIAGTPAMVAAYWLALAGMAGWLGAARLVYTFVQPFPLDVGADGISWRDMNGTKRFVAHRDIESVDLKKSPLTKKDTPTLLVLGVANSLYDEEIELGPLPEVVASAVRARIAQAQAQGEEGHPLPMLEKGAESLAAWRKKLRQLVGQGDYRDARVPRVRVASVLEDPLADTKQRLAAAIALAESTDPKTQEFGKKLTGAIAPSLADEELAHAFELVAKGELEDEALEALV